MPNVTGVVLVSVNGEQQRSLEGATLNPGGWERVAKMAPYFVGHGRKPVPAVVGFTLVHMADTDIIALNNLEDATVNFETDTGHTFIITGAACTKPVELTGGEGEAAVEMSGAPAVES